MQQGVDNKVLNATDQAVGVETNGSEIDVEIFRQSSLPPNTLVSSLETLARAAYAVGVYKGDLLEDWDLEWCSLEREQLRLRYVHTLRGLAEGFERFRRYDLALQYARLAAEADPSEERSQRAFIRLLFRTGDKVSALSQFRRFAGYLKSELGVEPDNRTVELVTHIRKKSADSWPEETVVSQPVQPSTLPLVGRVGERELLSAMVGNAVGGSGGSVLIVGEAGIGKSKLADWAMEEWAARGGLVARGRCIEFNDPIPYQPVLDAIGSVTDITGYSSTDVGRLPFPLQEAVTEGHPADSFRPERAWMPGKLGLFGWLLMKLVKVARRRPLLIVIEDLQWADTSSLDFLAYLVERTRHLKILVMLTARYPILKTGATANLEAISRGCKTTMRIGPLTPTETLELIRALLNTPRVDHDLLDLVRAETEGNPLFVIETIRLLQQQGRICGNGSTSINISSDTSVPAFDIPDGVRSTVEQRLKLIDSSTLRIARIASVLGRSFDEETLVMVAGTGANRLAKGIMRLLRMGIFEREHAGYRFAHDKIRAVCYESLPVRVRKTYHAKAAAALAQMPDIPIHLLAWHQSSACQWALATQAWERAGDGARDIYAYDEALLAYRHAISCARRDSHESAEVTHLTEIRLLTKSDEVLAMLGRPKERRNILDRLGSLCQRISAPSCRITLLIRKALLEEHVCNFGLSVRFARGAWYLAQKEEEHQAEVDALRTLAWVQYRAGLYRRSLAISHLALRKLGETLSSSQVWALWQAACNYIMLSNYNSASVYIDRASRIYHDLGLTTGEELLLISRAIVDRLTGRLDASRAGLLMARRLSRQVGNAIAEARISLHLASVDSLQGRLGDSIRGIRVAIAASRSIGYTRALMGCLAEVRNIGPLIGNYQWAHYACAHALRLARISGNRFLAETYEDSRARLLVEAGNLDEAMATVDRSIQHLYLEGFPQSSYLELLMTHGIITLLKGNAPVAIAELDAIMKTQVQIADNVLLIDTLTWLALAYASGNDSGSALATSERALRLLADVNYSSIQPQRVFWHHYLILEKFGREPRLQYLRRAVDFVEAQAATVSKAQARRLRRNVPLNRDILDAWERYKHEAQPDLPQVFGLLPPATPISVLPTLSSMTTDPDVRA